MLLKSLNDRQWVIFLKVRSRRNPPNSNYHLSINNCQAIEKSCIDRPEGMVARYILGWGGAARPLMPGPWLRQISLIFLPGVRQNSEFLIPCLRHLPFVNIETLSDIDLINWQPQNYLPLNQQSRGALYAKHVVFIKHWTPFLRSILKVSSKNRPRKDTLFKSKIYKIGTLLKKFKKMIKSIPCLRQKPRETYPGWPALPG